MKHIRALCAALIVFTSSSFAQHTIKLSIKKDGDLTPLPRATAIISVLKRTAFADSTGIVTFQNIAPGNYSIDISFVGFAERSVSVRVPGDTAAVDVLLEEEDLHEEEVIITATRLSRSISDIPTRVETISGEELSEKANMKPGDIRMALSESTGIQTQQTSATSYNSSIRIQGLDGKYTQMLRDGFPLYSGFAGGLSLMQVTPLDLKQIEVIKGSSSTLYGGGAIAGLVNLVSKTPGRQRELSFLANGTSAGGLDLSGFFSKKFNKVGLTVFGSRNTARAYDPADIGLTAIPKFERYTINPKLFVYGKRTTANVGFSYIDEDRVGGSIDYIKRGTAGYFERNLTNRLTTQAQVTHMLTDNAQLYLKNSYTRFNRHIAIPSYEFKGLQQATYSEITYINSREKTQWVLGGNFLTDDFKETGVASATVRSYHYNTLGVFFQNVWTPTKRFSLETGLRTDYVMRFGPEFLPRISAMFKIAPEVTIRFGGGLGYKSPTIFTEDAERLQFREILPINENTTNNEHSAGGNFDINYRLRLGEVYVTFNQLLFYTRLSKPLVLTATGSNSFEFLNAKGHIDTKGGETNIRVTYHDFKLFFGYTYADVNTHFNNVKSWYPLTSRHRLNNVLIYEKEESLKIGAEAYYFSKQKLNDGATGKAYWILGFMAEKLWERFSIFVNLENLTDTRQTRFDTIFTGNILNPTFRDIYAPVDGFVVNGGVKIKL